jgi:hypothetical protein
VNIIHKYASIAAATAIMITSLTLATAGTAQAQAQAKVYTWNYTMTAGDCTMFQGAKWTLYPDGSATFDATVTSGGNNDAWLMWASIKDANGAVLGTLANPRIQDPTDRAKFVKNLPDRRLRYRWFASGRFNSAKFDMIRGVSLAKHC